jgi:hypothetical protein
MLSARDRSASGRAVVGAGRLCDPGYTAMVPTCPAKPGRSPLAGLSQFVDPRFMSPTNRLLGGGLILLGGLIAAAAVLGPFVLDVIHYRTSPTTLNQIIGGDAAALLVVAQASIAVGLLALRGHPAAQPSWLPWPATCTDHCYIDPHPCRHRERADIGASLSGDQRTTTPTP